MINFQKEDWLNQQVRSAMMKQESQQHIWVIILDGKARKYLLRGCHKIIQRLVQETEQLWCRSHGKLKLTANSVVQDFKSNK